jgi:Tfp pilus assembly protein PilN
MNFRPLRRLSVVLLGDRLAVVALNGGAVEAFVVDAEHPAAALRAELESRRLPTRQVFLALSRSVVTVKPIDLPPVAGDVRQMIGFELERHLPFAADDACYDFVALPSDTAAERPAEGAQQRVLIAAADRRVVEAATSIASDAGLSPQSLTIAAHNLPSLAQLPRGQHVAWVHRAAGATDLLAFAGETLVMSRNVPGTEETLVAKELQRSLLALRWRACDAIWVSGDAAAADTSLTALGAPVTAPAWTPRAERQLESLPVEQRGALQLALAVAAGRAIRPLELLPAAVRPRRLTRPQAFTLGMGALTVVLALLALLAPGWRQHRQLGRIDAEIARLDPDVKAVDRVLRELERKRKLLTTVDGVEAAGVRPLPVLRDLTDLLPADAWLTTVSLDSKGVELTGAASAASALIPLLENSPRLERVEFSSPVTRGRDNKEQFRIRAAWEPGGAVAITAGQPVPAGVAPATGGPPPGVIVPAPAPGAPAPVTPPAGTPGAPAVPRRPAPGTAPGGTR